MDWFTFKKLLVPTSKVESPNRNTTGIAGTGMRKATAMLDDDMKRNNRRKPEANLFAIFLTLSMCFSLAFFYFYIPLSSVINKRVTIILSLFQPVIPGFQQ